MTNPVWYLILTLLLPPWNNTAEKLCRKKVPEGVVTGKNGNDLDSTTAVPVFAFATSEITFHYQQQGKTKPKQQMVMHFPPVTLNTCNYVVM